MSNIVRGVLAGERDRLLVENARLKEANAAMLDALKEAEWAGMDKHGVGFCPVCDRAETSGHAPDCALAAAIRKGEGI